MNTVATVPLHAPSHFQMNNFTGVLRRILGSFPHNCQRSKYLTILHFISHESNAGMHKDLNMQHLKAQPNISTEFPQIEHATKVSKVKVSL
jgi:hypothetical protein